MIRISPSAKVMLPHQSIDARAWLAALLAASGKPTPSRRGRRAQTPRNTSRQLIGGEQTAQYQPDEHAANSGHVGDTQRQAALIGRKRVGEDGGGIGNQEGGSRSPGRCGRGSATLLPELPVIQSTVSKQGCDGIDNKSQVVHPHPSEDVAETAEADDQHAAHDQVAQDHPQQVDAIRRRPAG